MSGTAKEKTTDSVELGILWEDYAEKYNRLSVEIRKANIDIKLLTDLERAAIDLYRR